MLKYVEKESLKQRSRQNGSKNEEWSIGEAKVNDFG